jgi:hypothetical protein
MTLSAVQGIYLYTVSCSTWTTLEYERDICRVEQLHIIRLQTEKAFSIPICKMYVSQQLPLTDTENINLSTYLRPRDASYHSRICQRLKIPLVWVYNMNLTNDARFISGYSPSVSATVQSVHQRKNIRNIHNLLLECNSSTVTATNIFWINECSFFLAVALIRTGAVSLQNISAIT